MWCCKWWQLKLVVGESPRFNVLKYFTIRLFPSFHFSPPFLSASTADRLLIHPAFLIDIQFLFDGSDGDVNPVLLQLTLPDYDNASINRD